MVAELHEAHRLGHGGILGNRRALSRRCREVADVDRLLGDPVAIRLLLGERAAELVVIDHAARRHIDLEHLSRPQAARGEHVGGIDLDGADLARKQEPVIARHVVASRTQPVAVERGTERAAIRESNGGRPVPRLHEHRLVGVVGATLRPKRFVVVPWLGKEHAHRAGERAAVHDEELQHVVENRGIGALAIDDGEHPRKIALQKRRVEVGLPSPNPVDVALQGVDFAVMNDDPVRVSPLPTGCGVGGVARVHKRHGGLDGGIVEVDEEPAHLRGNEHALVDDGAARHAADVEDLALECMLRVTRLLDGAATHVEPPFEGVPRLRSLGQAEERLEDRGHACTRRVAEVVRVNGDLAPEEHGNAASRATVLEDAPRIAHALFILREEEHGHGVASLIGKDVAALLSLLAEEVVRHLEEDARTVAGVLLEARAPAMLEVHEHRERVVEHLVRPLSRDTRQRTDAACIVLELRAIKAAFRGVR